MEELEREKKMMEEEVEADPIENQKEKCFVILPVLEIQFATLRGRQSVVSLDDIGVYIMWDDLTQSIVPIAEQINC